MVALYVPDCGDVIWLNFDPQAGHEQAGRRPAVVLSPEAYNVRTGLCVVVPITNQGKGYPFELPVPAHCRTTGFALCDQVRNLDWQARNAILRERAGKPFVQEIMARLQPLLTGQ
jgi:mRNA interferase MazF